MTRAIIALTLAACASKPARVELAAPLPTPQASESSTASLSDLACQPEPMAAIEIGSLDKALAHARDFAQRCCAGDENGDATVEVTAIPAGYDMRIAIEPDAIRASAGGECVRATFHRLLVKPFDGPEKSASIVVHLR